MGEWDAWIGKAEISEDLLTPGLVQRFRACIDSSQTGEPAPQGIHWCLCLAHAATADLSKDGHSRRTKDSFLPPIPLPRRMWASSKVSFKSPILVGADIRRTSVIAAITEKSGGSGPLVFVDIDHDISAHGHLAISERQTVVYRGAANGPQGPLAPGEGKPNLADWDWHREIRPSEAMLFRYSALTFNSHRIHYDRPYAVDEEGYRGLVVHGPLTASLLLDLAAHHGSPNQLTAFAFRGQSPAFVGETLHLVGRAGKPGAITLAALGSDGRLVMSAEASVD